jgi:hypothetical protein
MSKVRILFVILCIQLHFAGAKAQQVISSAGTYFENESGSVSWTLGEVFIETLGAGETILTQGFQQPVILVGTFYENPGSDFQLTAFPNPTKAFVTIQTDLNQSENMEYRLFDIRGSLILSDRLAGDHTRIDLDDYHPGIYFLNVHSEGVLLKVFKIIKQ